MNIFLFYQSIMARNKTYKRSLKFKINLLSLNLYSESAWRKRRGEWRKLDEEEWMRNRNWNLKSRNLNRYIHKRWNSMKVTEMTLKHKSYEAG